MISEVIEKFPRYSKQAIYHYLENDNWYSAWAVLEHILQDEQSKTKFKKGEVEKIEAKIDEIKKINGWNHGDYRKLEVSKVKKLPNPWHWMR